MKILCKVSFVLSIIFLIITVATTIMCSFLNRYVIIGAFGTNQLLAILPAFSILFFGIYIFARCTAKSIFVKFSIVFLVLTAVILLLVGFLPQYRYTTHVSDDNLHKIVVEEKLANGEGSVRFYRMVSPAVYVPVYNAILTADNIDKYNFGDFTVTFDDEYTRFSIPLTSSAEFLLPHK